VVDNLPDDLVGRRHLLLLDWLPAVRLWMGFGMDVSRCVGAWMESRWMG